MSSLLWVSASAFAAVALAVAAVARLLAAAARAAGAPPAHRARPPLLWRLGAPWVRIAEPLLQPRLRPTQRARLEAALTAAGLDAGLSAAGFMAGQLLAGMLAATVACGLRLALAAGADTASHAAGTGPALPAAAGLAACGFALGALLPRLWLRDRVAERRRRLLRQLPALLDLLTVALEAGQSASGALSLAGDRLPAGPLQAEIDRVLRDVRAGRSSAEALQAMVARLRIPAVAHLASALIVGTRQGSNLGPLLRAQAAQRRHERFVQAERAALQAPVKLLLPLVTCVFPGTFAILFFPVAVRLLNQGLL